MAKASGTPAKAAAEGCEVLRPWKAAAVPWPKAAAEGCEVLRPSKAAAEVLKVLRPAENVPRGSFEAQ